MRSLLFCAFSRIILLAAQAGAQDTRWTWMDGPHTGNQPGHYGQFGVPAAANNPGARQGAATWTDAQGNLWLFGGVGYDNDGTQLEFLADLWKYDVATGEWTWVKGPEFFDLPAAYGVYGVKGFSATNNRPGARYRAVSWTDAEGKFWLFGGDGYAASGGSAGLNDLWMFNPASRLWTWMGGTNERNHEGVFGTQGVPADFTTPPNLAGAVGWSDRIGNLWLFGGAQVPVTGPGYPKQNSLWKYHIASRRWTWMKNAPTAAGVYGSQGSGASTTNPGARFLAHSWIDAQGRLWLFGGSGHATSASVEGSLADLWRYDPPSNRWTWMKGTNALGQYAKHGDLNVPSHSNLPGGITEGLAWTDAQGDFWLYGGFGYAKQGAPVGELSALWRYRFATNQWTWMNGSDDVAQAPFFGTLGTPGPANTPGGQHAAVGWVTAPNRVWLFGGVRSNTPADIFYSALWQLAELNSVTVTGPNGVVLSGNANVGFGLTVIGTPIDRTISILNSGLTTLSGLNVAVAPIFSGDFTLVTPPAATLAPGESTTFTVRFTPTQMAVAQATITIDDSSDLAPFIINASGTGSLPTVTMGVTPDWVWEDAGTPFVFTFTRDGSTANPLTVKFSVSGEATLGGDYTVSGAETFIATDGTVIIPAGSASASVQITPISDTTAEDEEIVRLGLDNGADYLEGWPNLGEGVIASEELVPGGRDRSFYPQFESSILSTLLLAAAAQPDGKILIGGGFETVNGLPRRNLARFHADGSLDSNFNASLALLPIVQGIAVQPDGRIVIIGCETGIARFLADGSPDPSFTPLASYVPIYALALQADGKILIGGSFTTIHGEPRKNIARLHANGALDTSFDPGLGADTDVHCIAVQPDGKILVGGQFVNFGGQPRSGIVRLEDDGDVDPTFDPGTGGAGGTPMYIASIAVQPDGRIVAGGYFFTFDDQPRSHLVRLLPDGSLDPDFNVVAGTDYGINTLALQADGKIVLGGYFDTLNDQTVPSLGRLNADGTFDPTFQAVSDVTNGIFGLALLADGRVLSVGQPSIVDETHSGLTLRANQPATQTLRPFSGSIANWLRGGSAPELTSVTFDLSTDGGANWTTLGPGERIAGGWKSGNSPIPMTGHLRARGTAAGGIYGSSAGVHEQIAAFSRVPEVVIEVSGVLIVGGGGPPGPIGHPTLTDGSSLVDFGLKRYPVVPGGLHANFIVHNVGNDDLTGFSVTSDGDHPTDFPYFGGFSFPPPSTTIAPGEWKSVNISFSPKALGERNAVLHIHTSDADEGSFDIPLTGLGVTHREFWRHTYFGNIASVGNGADDADPDGDGNDNTLEFIAGKSPTDPNSRFQVRIEAVEGQPTHRKILFTAPAGQFVGSTVQFPAVVVQYRTSLTEGDWQPLGSLEWGFPEWWAIDTDAGGATKFYRVELTGQ